MILTSEEKKFLLATLDCIFPQDTHLDRVQTIRKKLKEDEHN